MPDPRLEFLRNEAGEKEGLGDAGIETFRDTPYASCAREAGQNSRDAYEQLPVRLTFNVVHLARGDVPAHGQLFATLTSCRAAAQDEKEKEFFDNALRVAEAPRIPVLEIADYNTTGLAGPPDMPGTPFHSLLKASGVSKKESETSGGSFGIGKNASFAVSDLQMVLYSSMYASPGGDQHVLAAQGKVKLVSHVDASGTARRMTGYWGDVGFAAITDPNRIPEWMRRVIKGTSIFCMGFRETDDWAELMTSSLVTNFFAAVHREHMVFEVANGKYQINRNTIGGLLMDEAIKAAAEKSGHAADMDFARQLYQCLVSPEAREDTLAIDGLGTMRVRILTDVGMPKRIGFVRNGMFITDNLQHFGHPFARFPGSRDFIALVEPADTDAGKLIKRLENPAHKELSAQRIADPVKRSGAERAMKTLGKDLRGLIKQTTGVQVQGTVILDELAHFFASTGRADSQPDDRAERDPETHVFSPARPAALKPVAPARVGGQQGGGSGKATGEGGNAGGRGQSTGSGSDGRGPKGRRTSIDLEDVRNVIRSDDLGRPRARLIHFTPPVDGEILVSVEATGLYVTEVLRIMSSDKGSVAGGTIALSVSGGSRTSVLVTLSEPYEGPIEVTAVLAAGAPEAVA